MISLSWHNGLIVDLFAGGGGASTGIEWALGRSPDHGLNHEWDALRNHALNHPDTQHHVDDIREAIPLVITGGKPVELLWASPDCRHFSRAKGGKPCNPKVRSLPWEIKRWAKDTRPRLVCIENVPEMRTWGPLYDDHDHGCTSRAQLEDEHPDDCTVKACHFARPIPEAMGTTWLAWIASFEALGYKVGRDSDGQAGWILHAHHHGAPTSRKRLFIVMRLDGVMPVRPEPTHGPGLLPYRTAADCIDWSDLGESIFGPDGEPRHAPATCRRIAKGIVRFVLEAQKPFLVPFYGTATGGAPVDAPLGTVTSGGNRGGGHHALVVPTLIHTGNGERPGQSPRIYNIQNPLGTVVAGGQKHALVAAFLAKHYGGVVGHDARRPLGTVTSVDHHSVVAANLMRFNQNGAGSSLHDPAPTLVASSQKHALVAAFMSTYYGQSVGQPVDAPMATQTTKHRHALVTVVIDGVTYVIVDIRMRMLQPHELQLAQGFPSTYRLEGTKRLKVKLIGNSVPPQLAEAVVRANTTHTTRPLSAVA